VRGVLSRVPADPRRVWGAAFLGVLVGGLLVLHWLTFRRSDVEPFVWAGVTWIVLLTVTGLGYGAR